MTLKNEKTLKEKIMDEMSISYANALEKNFEIAKKYIRITSEGKVHLPSKEMLTGKDQILLYLIGKIYAKEAGLTIEISVTNDELATELGIPTGSLLPWLKELRDKNQIKTMKKGKYVSHQIQINIIEKILNNIDKKLKKKAE